MADEIKVSLDLDIKNAIKGVEQFNKQATSALMGLGTTISSVKTAVVALAGAFAFGKIVKEAMQADDSLMKMGVALKLSGDYSKEAMKGLEDYSSQIQKSTGYTAGLTQESLAMAKNFGLSNQASKELVGTATDLAKVTGGSLDTATRQLIDSYSGQGRALQKLFPELRNYSEAQLKAGAAIAVVRARIGGTAEAMNNTFSGALTGVTNSFNDFITVIGQFITQNPAVIKIVQGVSSVIGSVTGFLSANKKGVSDFITALTVGFVDAIPTVISGLQFLVGTLGALVKILAMATIGAADFIKTLMSIELISTLFQGFIRGINLVVAAILEVTQAILSIPMIGEPLKLAGFDVESARNSLKELTLGALENVVTTNTESMIAGLDSLSIQAAKTLDVVDSSVASIGKGLTTAKTAAKSFGAEIRKAAGESKSALDAIKGPMSRIVEEADLVRRAFEDMTKEIIGVGSKNPFEALLASLNRGELARKIKDVEGKFESLKGKFDGVLGLSGAIGVGNLAIQGQNGAKSLLSGAASAAANAYVPGSGEFAGNLMGAILNGPERKEELAATKKQIAETEALIKNLEETALNRPLSMLEQAQLEQSKNRKSELEQLATTIEEANKKTLTYQVREFVKALPELIKIIPVVLKDFVKEIPSLLGDLIPELVAAFIEALPGLIEAWVSYGPKLVEGLFRGLGNLLGKIFGDGAAKFLDDLGKAILAIPGAIVDAIKDALSGLTGGAFDGGGFEGIAKGIGNTLLTGGMNIVAGALGIGGDVGKVIQDPIGAVGSIFGFAKGGIVPGGFPNDTYPALLSSGETVLPPPVSARFNDFMEKTETPSRNDGDLNTVLSLLEGILNADRTISINVDGRNMADVIYTLNKKGYRTA